MLGEESIEFSVVEKLTDISGSAQVKGKVPGSRTYGVRKRKDNSGLEEMLSLMNQAKNIEEWSGESLACSH